MVQAGLSTLQELSRWLLNASLSPERIDLWSGSLAAAAGRRDQPLLLLSLASIDATTLDEQIRCIGERAPDLEVLDDAAAADLLDAELGPGAATWLLRLAVPPAQACNLLASDALQGIPLCLAAGSGIGDGWASGATLARHRVEALRRHCQSLGAT